MSQVSNSRHLGQIRPAPLFYVANPLFDGDTLNKVE